MLRGGQSEEANVVRKATGNAVIGEDLLIAGSIRNGGEVEVLGTVKGSISAERIVVHPGGRILGSMTADAAEVNGFVDGRIRVRNLISIGADGTVQGDVRYGSLALAPGGNLAAEVRNVPPEIGGDFEVVVRRGRSVRITTADLMATDAEDPATDLVFAVSGVDGGYVFSSSTPQLSLTQFTQADILAGRVAFGHDGGDGEGAGFDVVVSDSAGATSGAPRRVVVLVV